MTHKVTLKPSGKEFEVRPEETVLSAALRSGLSLPHSCRGGSCLSCRARIAEGRVTYPRGLPAALGEEEAAQGWSLLCQAHADSDLTIEAAPREIPGNIRVRRLPCRVDRLERLCEDVMGVFLKLPGFEPFEFLAGQYVDILLADGRRRSFSMANPPRDSKLLELHIRRIPGGRFTRYVFDRLKERALLRIEGPLGHFYWREDSSRPVIMVAGGTGYAPIKAMLRHVYAKHAHRDIRFYWGVRALADLYDPGIGDHEDWSGFRFTPVLSHAREQDHWSGRSGLVHRAVLKDHPDLSAFDVYVAGPPAMVEAARLDFRAAGLPADRLFFDSFDYASDSEDSPRGV